jgi:S1-C subfamily serine protease
MSAEHSNAGSVREDERRNKGSSGAFVVHLYGAHRGATEPLGTEPVRIGTSADADIHFPEHKHPEVSPDHATLYYEVDGHFIRSIGDSRVRVNGQEIETRRLERGDMIELGDGGPILRYRQNPGLRPRKTMRETLQDCLDSGRLGSDRLAGKSWIFLRSLPRALHSQTAPAYRAIVLVVLLVLALGVAGLALNSWRLERRLDRETQQLYAELLEDQEGVLSEEEIDRLRGQLETRLTDAEERVEALEEQSEATRRIISNAARSIVFLQGSYGFLDPIARRPLRLVTGPDGHPLPGPFGAPLISPDGDGPVLERLLTGTGFVATREGLLLTNRHIVLPWDYDDVSRRLMEQGLVPVMHRMIGYLPDEAEPFEVEVVLASEEADVAVLRCSGVTTEVVPLDLAAASPFPGDEVVVMGYPTGIRALLARSDPALVAEILGEGQYDFWTVARRLSEGGHIAPLATRGIVGQVTPATVVYDAETTLGGSGGPVIGQDGTIVAINAAILTEFGGSNLGVPADRARLLLERVAAAEASQDSARAAQDTTVAAPDPRG